MKTLAAALLCLFPLFAAADAPDLKAVETWLEGTPRAREYRGGKERILGIFRDADGRDIPLELLFDKLKEGTSKRIPPEDLIARLAEEGFRLYMAREAVHASGLVPAGSGIGTALLRNASLAMLSGLSEGTLYAVLSAATESGKGPEGAGEFLSAFVRMHAVASFSPEHAGPERKSVG